MQFKDLLPIGTVVLLQDAQKKLMIYGIGQTDAENDIDYDYIGVLYPEGNMGDGSQFLFNHEDIAEIIFKGYEDEERTAFLNYIQKSMDESAQ